MSQTSSSSSPSAAEAAAATTTTTTTATEDGDEIQHEDEMTKVVAIVDAIVNSIGKVKGVPGNCIWIISSFLTYPKILHARTLANLFYPLRSSKYMRGLIMKRYPEIKEFEKERLKAMKFRYECRIARREADPDLSLELGRQLVKMMYREGTNDAEEVERLCRQGADIEAKGYVNSKLTPLLSAANHAHAIGLKVLIDCGADMEVKDNDGDTALMLATGYGSFEDVKLLIDSGADIRYQRPKDGITMFLHAARSSKDGPGKMQLFLDCGANIGETYDHGLTALHEAARLDRTENIEFLLNLKANIDAQDSEGHTPLIWAVQHGQTASVRLLIDSGANLDLKDWRGNTALDRAIECNKPGIAEMLERAAYA